MIWKNVSDQEITVIGRMSFNLAFSLQVTVNQVSLHGNLVNTRVGY